MASVNQGPGSADAETETEPERLARNWEEILQELRVTQTGTQIITGFLLTIPFQARFTDLTATQVGIYLALVSTAAVSTVLALAPVSLHRALFRRHAKPQIVQVAHVLVRLALVAIAITLSGTTLLIFDVVLGRTAGIVAGAVTLVLTCIAWLALPVFAGSRRSIKPL
jgi:hypothetical protein